MLRSRFGIAWDPSQGERLDAEGRASRQRLIDRAGGPAGYWAEHLARSGNEIALVNQYTPEGTDGRQLRWVGTISTPLAPLPGASLAAMTFLYAPSEMARAIRMYLLFAPERTLFGTDPMAAPMIPIGPETAHLMLCKEHDRARRRVNPPWAASALPRRARRRQRYHAGDAGPWRRTVQRRVGQGRQLAL